MCTRISDGAFLGLAVVAASLFAADAYLIRQLRVVSQDTLELDRYVAASIGGIRQSAARTNTAQHEGIETLAAQLDQDRRATREAASDARTVTQRYAAFLTERLARAREIQHAWVKGQLSDIRISAQAAIESVRRIERQLHETRVAAASAGAKELRNGVTPRDLRASADGITGDVKRQRGAVAAQRAGFALDQFEFHLTKTGAPYVIDGTTFRLCKTAPQHHRYSLEILSGDRSIRTEERTVQEPVRVLSARGRLITFVAEEIGKNEIRGWVRIPRG